MTNFKTNGVYLKSFKAKKQGLESFFSSESEWISYSYFLFFKNHKSNIFDIYNGMISGDFIVWMKSFVSWSQASHKLQKIKSYEIIDEDKIIFFSDIKGESSLTYSEDGRLFLNDTSLKNQN